ncbi:lipoprotein [Citrobacter amalonaticus]|nr:lipoprotein [Citrobacter amalonaticus]
MKRVMPRAIFMNRVNSHRCYLSRVAALGDRVANAFAQEWQNLGGGTVLQQKFGSTAELRMALTAVPALP